LPTDVKYFYYLHCLALALALQFSLYGDASHLEEASQLYHHARDILLTGHPWRPVIISGLARILGLRFRETGEISELNRAIDLDGESAASSRPSEESYTSIALQMISHLCLRFELLQKNDDLETAMIVAEELLESLPGGSVLRAEAILRLAKARFLRTINKSNAQDIDLTIEQLLSVKDELSCSALGPESLRTLSACYVVKFRQSPDVHHILRAKDVISELLEIVDPGHYERFQSLIDAAKLYMEHGTPYHNIDIALKFIQML
jgi:hypothetical protein